MSEEKEDKPKKLFELNFTIWDDGEITNSIVEIVQQERGAPKKWHLEPSDFVASLKTSVSTTPIESFGPVLLELVGFKRTTFSESSGAKDAEFNAVDDDDFDDD